MARPRQLDRPVRRHVTIRESVLAQVDIILCDPLRGTPAHGALSQLVTQLLADWLAKQRAQARNVDG